MENLLYALKIFDNENYLEVDKEKIRRCYLMLAISQQIAQQDLIEPWSIIVKYMQESYYTLPRIFFCLLTEELFLSFWSNNLNLVQELAFYLVYGINKYEELIPKYQLEAAKEFADKDLKQKLESLLKEEGSP